LPLEKRVRQMEELKGLAESRVQEMEVQVRGHAEALETRGPGGPGDGEIWRALEEALASASAQRGRQREARRERRPRRREEAQARAEALEA